MNAEVKCGLDNKMPVRVSAVKTVEAVKGCRKVEPSNLLKQYERRL